MHRGGKEPDIVEGMDSWETSYTQGEKGEERGKAQHN